MINLNRNQDGIWLSEQVQEKAISPRELVEQAFRTIEEENPILNAVIHTRKEKALKEASERDFTGKPFAGIPILVKGLGQNMAGEPSTSGSRLLKDSIAGQTSHFVRTLEEAGFVVIGQTNTPEFGFKNISDPALYGPTRNPWNTDYSPGGSSGGAAASIVSNMVPIAGASDGGGSIRIPASFTGLIGLKPTRGRTPIGPGSGRGWQGASVGFVLTKSIRDTASMMDVMQTIQPAAAFQTPLFEGGYQNALTTAGKKRFRIAYSLESPVGSPVNEAAKEAVRKTVSWLEKQGYAVTEATPEVDGIALMKSYYIMNSGETAAMFANIEAALKRPVTKEDMELMTWVLFNAGQSISAATYSNSLKSWDQAAEILDTFHQDYDLLLTPATADVAPRVDAKLQTDEQLDRMHHVTNMNEAEQQRIVWDMFADSLAITPFTQQANLTGQPAISLPVHLAKTGLPIGVQFTAPKGKEDWLLDIAQVMEQDGLFI